MENLPKPALLKRAKGTFRTHVDECTGESIVYFRPSSHYSNHMLPLKRMSFKHFIHFLCKV